MQATPRLERTVVKNASANLVRLAGSGVIALLVPPLLVRVLSVQEYSAWALLLQITAYIGFLDFGIQIAVARFVAHADELNDLSQRDGIASTALMLLTCAAAIGVVVLAVLTWQLPHVFKAMPAQLVWQGRICLLLMGTSFAVGLPFYVIHAVFIGLQRNEIPVGLTLANRLAVAIFTVTAALHHWGLPAMGAGLAVANLASYGLSYAAWRAWAPHVRLNMSLASTTYAREIAGYTLALGAWFAGMLMVSGLDLFIVGIFDYPATAYYAVALTLTNFISQAQSTAFAALMPASAVLTARGDAEKLTAWLVSSTRYGMLMLLAIALPLLVGGKTLLRVWVGNDYAAHATLFLQVLVLANVIRLSALPYATLLLGTGEQRKVILSPLAEGVTNLVGSIVGAAFLGAIGVALGTLLGSFVSLALHVFYNMPRTFAANVDRSVFLRNGLFRPLLCACPFALLMLLRAAAPGASLAMMSFCSAIAIAGTALLLWRYGLLGSERRRLQAVFRAS
jgi:O-antigen/teichoic acid export membrane protein